MARRRKRLHPRLLRTDKRTIDGWSVRCVEGKRIGYKKKGNGRTYSIAVIHENK